jgi:opacity protein-like surface antigen
MKNIRTISDLGPQLLEDYSNRGRPNLLGVLATGLIFWVLLVILVGGALIGVARGQDAASDPIVMKIYPDGTKVALRWSEVGKSVDNGEKFGGAPRIVAYDPAKDGIVPIGERAKTTATTATNTAVPSSSSVVSPDQPAKMDYTNAEPAEFDENLGPMEGFAFRTGVGPSFQQSLSGRSNNGTDYYNLTFKPGIRFDLEPSYNVTDWFRVGLETAFIYNRAQRFADGEINIYPGDDVLGSSGFFQVPVLVNVRFQFPSEGPWKGYVGGGLGAGWNVLQLSLEGQDPYTSYHWNLNYEVTAGFTYTISPGFDLDIGYRMLAAPNPSFQNSGVVGGLIDPGSFKASYNHSLDISLAWRF